MRNLAAFVFYAIVSSIAHGQILHYDVVKGSKIIGNVNVARFSTGATKTIDIQSRVEFKLIFSFTIDFNLEETFENGTLKSGSATNELNGVTQKESKIEKRKKDYNLIIGGIPNRLSERSIDYSISEIYFKEPQDNQKAFSQHFGLFLHFEKIGDHKYKLISPDGENHYIYESGICTEVKIFRDYANYSFRINPESYAQIRQRADTVGN